MLSIATLFSAFPQKRPPLNSVFNKSTLITGSAQNGYPSKAVQFDNQSSIFSSSRFWKPRHILEDELK